MAATPYLLIIGEREALAWILRHQRMAFPATRRTEVDALQPGDILYLLTTRGCFHNPTRDATRIIGHATAASPVTVLDTPYTLGDREFPRGCDLTIDSLTPYLTGVPLAPLVDRLDTFPHKHAWSITLRRPLLRLTPTDARLIDRQLRRVAGTHEEHLDGYLTNIRPVQAQRPRATGNPR